VTAEPDFMHVVLDLLMDARGAEVYVRQPARMGLSAAGGPLTFHQLQDAARGLPEPAVCLGWIGADGVAVLAPRGDALCELSPGTRLVLLAEDH
jgi:hypothetical protein